MQVVSMATDDTRDSQAQHVQSTNSCSFGRDLTTTPAQATLIGQEQHRGLRCIGK
ncbi:hypothetical protein ABBQ38_000898 [Trebouxia sp. C0009 RCD-2024]